MPESYQILESAPAPVLQNGHLPRDFAEAYYYIRHPNANVLRPLYKRLVLCARAGALATETKLAVDFQGGVLNILPNNTLAQVTLANLNALNDIRYTVQELRFALQIQETLAKPKSLESVSKVFNRSGGVGKGSTDVGDVSWAVPTSGFSTACWVPGTLGHSWQATACGGTSIARKGMSLAARVLAATAWDFYKNQAILTAARAEHNHRLGQKQYESLMQPGQKPPLDYRKPPKR